MKKLFVVFLLMISVYSCYDTKRNPINIDSEDITSHQLIMDSVIADTTKVITAGLPILIDSARNILIHQVIIIDGNNPTKSHKRYSMSGSSYVPDYTTNLIFEEQETNTKRTLTDLALRINKYSFQHELYKMTGKEFIFYTVIDNDSNRDGIFDSHDFESFYISHIDGTSFTKITKNNESYIEGKFVSPQKKYYFKTVHDSNRDGYLTNQDLEHFYYIDFNKEPYQIEEYFPLDILKK